MSQNRTADHSHQLMVKPPHHSKQGLQKRDAVAKQAPNEPKKTKACIVQMKHSSIKPMSFYTCSFSHEKKKAAKDIGNAEFPCIQ